jgi:hypothetical protein
MHAVHCSFASGVANSSEVDSGVATSSEVDSQRDARKEWIASGLPFGESELEEQVSLLAGDPERVVFAESAFSASSMFEKGALRHSERCC